MKQGIRSKTDPMEREIEVALRPGVFIGYREGFSFVTQLEELAAQIRTPTPRRTASRWRRTRQQRKGGITYTPNYLKQPKKKLSGRTAFRQ
jgi:hypothetical protein